MDEKIEDIFETKGERVILIENIQDIPYLAFN